MKVKNVLILPAIFALGAFCTTISTDKKHAKTPVNTGNFKQFESIKYVFDTLIVTDENFNNNKIEAAGIFWPYQNKISVRHFKTNSKNKNLVKYCDGQNSLMPLNLRHEQEHARKAHLTKQTLKYTPHTRARIAAINEIVAPCAEIIEAADYPHKHNTQIPAHKLFTKHATEMINKINPGAAVDFNNQTVADIVLMCALNEFVKKTKQGLYVATIRREFNKTYEPKYTPNKECDLLNATLFVPDINLWGPLWDFHTARGPVNLWRAASPETKQNFIQTIDKIIEQIPGKNYAFLTFQKTR